MNEQKEGYSKPMLEADPLQVLVDKDGCGCGCGCRGAGGAGGGGGNALN